MTTYSMKKKKGKGCRRWLLPLLVTLFLMPLVGKAQSHQSQNLLNVRSLYTGTNSTGATNLSLSITNSGMIHHANLSWTNLNGTLVRNTNSPTTTNSISGFEVFKPVSLWTDRNGNPINYYFPSNTLVALSTNAVAFSGATLLFAGSSPNGTNAQIDVILTPLYDGVTPILGTAQDFTLTIATAGSGYTTIATNLPTWRWPGAKAVGVKRIIATTGPDATGISGFWIHKLSVNGFVP